MRPSTSVTLLHSKMDKDRRKIWRIVANNYRQLKEKPPDGYVPVVEVFLVGHPEPVRLAEAHTTRDPSFPWTLLVAETDGDGRVPSPSDLLVFAPEECVQRIQIRFVPSGGRRVGFGHQVSDDLSPMSKHE